MNRRDVFNKKEPDCFTIAENTYGEKDHNTAATKALSSPITYIPIKKFKIN